VHRRAIGALLATAVLAGVLSARPNVAGASSGRVNVLYAGSLTTVMMDRLGPAFERASGISVSGFAGGSQGLASQIKGEVERGDVFLSASPTVNAALEGPANGDWVSWYATFAVSALEIGYNPHSRFARALRKGPWYRVIAEPGIQVGRTDPAVDPKGVLTVDALERAARLHHLPALARLAHSSTDVFPEESLVGRLQAGQLDAGFFYAVEASAAGIPTVALGKGFSYDATYTVTILRRAPDPAAAVAFVSFLLSKPGAKILSRAGLTLIKPTVHGDRSAVPRALRARLLHR
jgi:molybdate/tungstate transport system substrate-binding protein